MNTANTAPSRVVLRETNRKSTLNYEKKKKKTNATIREVVGLGESWEQGRGPLPRLGGQRDFPGRMLTQLKSKK